LAGNKNATTEKMNARTEGPDDWRKREIRSLIVRLLLGLIQSIGVIASIWLLLTIGFTRVSCGVVIVTLFFALLPWLLSRVAKSSRAV
jgi:hypothetical protein